MINILMKRFRTNLVLGIGAVLIALLLFFAPRANSLELLVLDDPDCYFCAQFKNGAGATYSESSFAEWAPLTYVPYGIKLKPRPDIWPAWFSQAKEEERIGKIRGTPTFILYDTLPGDDEPQEIVSILGYSDEEWFYDRLQYIRETYEAWKAKQ